MDIDQEQIEGLSKRKIKFLQQLVIEGDQRRNELFDPLITIDEVFEERQIYGEPGLPAVVDISMKRKKTEEDRIMHEKMRAPPNTPRDSKQSKTIAEGEEFVEEKKTEMVIGGQTFEVNQSTLAGGANPIRKTADDQKVEEMAEEALEGLDDIEGLDEAVEEAVAVIETEEAQATEEAKRLKKKNWAESFYETKIPVPI